jgi:hypothetical protein
VPSFRSRQSDEEPPVPLTGVRAEFRTALEAEIEAAKRTAANSAIPVVSGRRLDARAQSYQYLFSAVSILNVPSDSPAELLIEGRDPIDAIVVSVEGLAVTISVERDLGEFVPSARLRSDLVFLLKRLIKRIEDTRDQPNSAGDRLLGAPASGVPEVIDDEFLTDSQDAALGVALGRDVTFIWGPPGTGKTQTIGAIGEQLYRRGRSVLLVSHTNAAVDHALLKIANALDGEFELGALLRLGDPSDPRLREREDLLLGTAIRERLSELTERRDELAARKQELAARIAEADRDLEIATWAASGDSELADYRAKLIELKEQEADLELLRRRVAGLGGSSDEASRRTVLREASEIEELVARADMREAERPAFDNEARRAREEIEDCERALDEAESDLRTAEQITPLVEREQALPRLSEQRASVEALAAKQSTAQTELDALSTELATEEEKLRASEAANSLQRRLRRLPKPELQRPIVDDLRSRHAGAEARRDALRSRVAELGPQLAELEELDSRLTPHRHLGSVAHQHAMLEQARGVLDEALDRAARLQADIDEAEELIAAASHRAAAFEQTRGASAAQVAARVRSELEELDQTRAQLRVDEAGYRRSNGELTGDLAWRCLRLVALGLLDDAHFEGADAGLAAVALGHAEARGRAIDTEAVRAEKAGAESEVQEIDGELDEIEQAMAEMRREVIADAAVVATTLTRAYLWDEIQSRRFDTVVLDEASMAPIPALWIAAQLAEANIVIVGDFRQLPPIKHSDHPLAEHWLGQDVFEVSGVRAAYDRGAPPEHFVQLTEQFRMHPDISAIANALVYDNTLTNHPSTAKTEVGEWYCDDWGPDRPVTLVDTGSLRAWVSSIVSGGRPTRVNFLSAVICVDLASRMLAEATEAPDDGSARIIIATPYRGQARLLELLIRDAGLDALVRAGTTHTFQGSEAPVVIFDLVIDEPHWRVALMIGTYDETNRRLLNVALTRAQRRLVCVGNFDYIRRGAKKAFLGNEFLPFIEQRHETVSADEVISIGLAARAAHAQTLVSGAAVEASHGREVMTQADVYPRLIADFTAARERIVIFSPFITENRLGEVLPHLRAADERGVSVYVFTKAPEDRNKGDQGRYQSLEDRLTANGVTVVHKPRMHEKLVFVDDEIAWAGSLNMLSFRDTAEWMARWCSGEVVADFSRPVSLDEVLGAYQAGEARCPVCEGALVPAEGREGIYWRCINKDYTQNLDKPIPRDGLIRCARSDCDGAVEFREGTKAPFWRCAVDHHHRQAYHHAHLRLPKMREVIAKSVGVRRLRQLEAQAGLGSQRTTASTSKRNEPVRASEDYNPTLFDVPAAAPEHNGNGQQSGNGASAVTAADLARRMSVDPRTFRHWLRDRAAAGHPLLQAHEFNGAWVFTSDDADQLELEYRRRRRA